MENPIMKTLESDRLILRKFKIEDAQEVYDNWASEALRVVIEYLLNDCDFHLIECRHISGNPASGRVMEKAGMHKDAILRDRRVNKFTGKRNDSIIYSITKSEL